jgi:hypothetical protein
MRLENKMASDRYIPLDDFESIVESNPEFKADFLDRIMSNGALWREAFGNCCEYQSKEGVTERFQAALNAHNKFSVDRSYDNSFDEYVGTACISANNRRQQSEAAFRAEAVKINSRDVAIMARHIGRVAAAFNSAGNSVERLLQGTGHTMNHSEEKKTLSVAILALAR